MVTSHRPDLARRRAGRACADVRGTVPGCCLRPAGDPAAIASPFEQQVQCLLRRQPVKPSSSLLANASYCALVFSAHDRPVPVSLRQECPPGVARCAPSLDGGSEGQLLPRTCWSERRWAGTLL